MELVKLSSEEKSEMDLVFDAATEAENKLVDLLLQKMNLEQQINQQAMKVSGLRGELQNRASIMGRMHGLTASQKASYDRKEGAFKVETVKASAPMADRPGPALKSLKKEKA